MRIFNVVLLNTLIWKAIEKGTKKLSLQDSWHQFYHYAQRDLQYSWKWCLMRKKKRHWHRLRSVYPWHNTGTSSIWEGIMNVVWGQPRPQPIINTHHRQTKLFTGAIIFYSLSFNFLTSISWIFIWREKGTTEERWLGGIPDSVDVSLSQLQERVKDREA